MDSRNDQVITAQAPVEVREQDKTLAVRLKTAKAPARGSEMMQLAAIYAALPEGRRQHWFERLSLFGLAAEVLDGIVERANRLIQSPDWQAQTVAAGGRSSTGRPVGLQAGRRRATDP